MKKTIFLYSGEGTSDSESGVKLIKHAASWNRIQEIVSLKLDMNLEQLWEAEIGRHSCPYSPLLTLVSQICLSDLWRQWGYDADLMIGHSTGELAAAYEAGLYALDDVLDLSYRIGLVASRLDGVMLHGELSDERISNLPVNLSSINFETENCRHVTLSGYADEMEAFHKEYPDFIKMRLPHPWHHSDYRHFADQLKPIKSSEIQEGVFVSGVTTKFETRLTDRHWRQWLVQPIDFIQSMRTIQERYGNEHLDIIEIGFHPVLEKCCNIFQDSTYVSSMFRGEDDVEWISYQRKKLDPSVFESTVKKRIDAYRPQLDPGTALAYQGLGSIEFTELSDLLQPYFPSLAPQDFYRYKTINQLIDRFGISKPADLATNSAFQKNDVVISAMSCRFPSSVETLPQFWDMLTSKTDQVRREPTRGESEAGFLNDSITRFDHKYFNISLAEAGTMDPQQILALELTEMLWRDADIDPQTLNRNRVGVYIGVWNSEYRGDRSSVYYPTGTNPSIIASRISFHYDLRGPSWVSNTACSSSLIAIHYAAKDIEAGRVDYAIAGGVNMLLDEAFFVNMKNSGFLSIDNRCKAFDDTANGYVRAEGGGLLLLSNKSLTDQYYAEIAGSAINQNGGRSQLITAPHPEAQEELIAAACQDAKIPPERIAYIECHGTGTKIGDPIEISAISNTVAKNRKDTCYIGTVKSIMGHLESAAGIAGLIKSVAILNHGIIPPNLHFHKPNQFIDFDTPHIQVVTEETEIDHQAAIGVSSFGFGGSNAHIVVKGADVSVRKNIRPLTVPFDRKRAVPLSQYLQLRTSKIDNAPVTTEIDDSPTANIITREDIDKLIGNLFFQLTSINEIDPDIELTDQGLDSMSGAELISKLEAALKIDIGPENLFNNPLFDQFVDEVYSLTAAGQN